jgi:hypothetical protein
VPDCDKRKEPVRNRSNSPAQSPCTVIAANATAGFFITTRGFTRDAEAYAATAPLRLVDGPKLIASIKRGMKGAAMPDSYKGQN